MLWSFAVWMSLKICRLKVTSRARFMDKRTSNNAHTVETQKVSLKLLL